ncbi:MAG: urease accessory protein UreF [Pseudomonadota bacterium]
MTDALLKLHAWLSPGYPVGAYTYSHGLEAAVEGGLVADAATLADWGADCLTHGAGRSDAILLAHAWRAPKDEAIAELATALAPSAERLLEAEAQGAAFARVTGDAWGRAVAPAPYPVAVGRAAAAHGIALEPALTLYLQAFAANLVSATVRLVPLGQTEGQQVLAALSPTIEAVAAEALTAPLDAIGGCAIGADIASMRHETQTVRLFRS